VVWGGGRPRSGGAAGEGGPAGRLGHRRHAELGQGRGRGEPRQAALGQHWELPQAYRTQLGKWFVGGRELSGGQWQKIALARAFMREGADVIVLDEPTAAMDAEAEAEAFERVRRLAADKMVVLVSHRFSTVRMADEILVLQGGRIIERGGHAELLARGGRYARLFTLQAEAYR